MRSDADIASRMCCHYSLVLSQTRQEGEAKGFFFLIRRAYTRISFEIAFFFLHTLGGERVGQED